MTYTKGSYGARSVALATPNYAGNGASRTDGYVNTMARMLFRLTDEAKRKVTAHVTAFGDARLSSSVAAMANAGYVEFLLQEANHALREKVDVFDTLAHRYSAYALGAAAPSFSYRAMLYNTWQDDQAENMFRLYWGLLRAAQLAEVRVPVTLLYDGWVVKGALTKLGQRINAADESVVECDFEILVKSFKALPNEYSTAVTSKARFEADDQRPDAAKPLVRAAPAAAVVAVPEKKAEPTPAKPPPAAAADPSIEALGDDVAAKEAAQRNAMLDPNMRGIAL